MTGQPPQSDSRQTAAGAPKAMNRHATMLMALEPRIAFDAAGAMTVAAASDSPDQPGSPEPAAADTHDAAQHAALAAALQAPPAAAETTAGDTDSEADADAGEDDVSAAGSAPGVDLNGDSPEIIVPVSDDGVFFERSANVGEPRTSTLTFNLDAEAAGGFITVTASMKTIDEAFLIVINGRPISTEAITVDSFNPPDHRLAFADGDTVDLGWIANVHGLPRVEVRLTTAGIEFWGTRTSESTQLERLHYPADLAAPVFVTGENTFAITIPDSPGPEAVDGRLTVTTRSLYLGPHYTEDGPGVPVVGDVIITDLDSDDMQAATVTITNADAGDRLTLSGPLPAGITAVWDPDTFTLSLTGAASKAAYEQALGLVHFSSSSQAPSTVARQITVTVSDGETTSRAAVASIAVIAVNDAPVARDDAIRVGEGASLRGFLPAASDPDGDAVAYGLGAPPLHGSVSVNPDGSYVYTPARGYSGPDSFTYTISDGIEVRLYTVLVNVVAAPLIELDQPVILSDAGEPQARPDADVATEDADISILDAVAQAAASDAGARAMTMAVSLARGGAPIAPPAGSKPAFAVSTTLDQGTLYLSAVVPSVRGDSGGGSGNSVEYRVTLADGKALPEWMRLTPGGMLIIHPPVGTPFVDIRIHAERDGEVVEDTLRVDLSTGMVSNHRAVQGSIEPGFSPTMDGERLQQARAAAALRQALDNRTAR